MSTTPIHPTVHSARALLTGTFGPGTLPSILSVPGRVNLIGEHIDYHDLPVLPMAIQRRVSVAFRPGTTPLIRAVSADYGQRSLTLTPPEPPFTPGDWQNYLAAAVTMIAARWKLSHGIDAAIASDLPPAAGLSSSSALLTSFALALLHANRIDPTITELMEVLPDGEQYVGTRGGGMDHAAVLAARAGSALLIDFAPLRLTPIPIPAGWSFLIAHSLTTAEKSGALKAEYNRRRTAGTRALAELRFPSYRAALDSRPLPDLLTTAARLPEDEQRAFRHVVTESVRVQTCIDAIHCADIQLFGEQLSASHQSLRDDLAVSNPALDELVECAIRSGAAGARLTGAGFGGCVLALCETSNIESVKAGLLESFYQKRIQRGAAGPEIGFVPQNHLFVAEPSEGALSV